MDLGNSHGSMRVAGLQEYLDGGPTRLISHIAADGQPVVGCMPGGPYVCVATGDGERTRIRTFNIHARHLGGAPETDVEVGTTGIRQLVAVPGARRTRVWSWRRRLRATSRLRVR